MVVTFVDIGIGRVKAAAIVATSRMVKSAKLAAGTLAAPFTTPKSFVSAWSFAIDPGMLTAVVPTNLGSVSERHDSLAIVVIQFAARSFLSAAQEKSRAKGVRARKKVLLFFHSDEAQTLSVSRMLAKNV